MTDLTLVRHGETVWHAEHRYAGSSDIPLTERGRQQAEWLAAWAERTHLDAVRASPLVRAHDTAEAVTRATGLTTHTDARLTEVDFGAAEGLTSAEMASRFGAAREAFEQDPVAHHLPGGEDPQHAAERMTACLTELANGYPDGKILVVGHGTIQRLVLCRLLGLPLRDYRRHFPIVRNCGLTTIRWNPAAEPDTVALIEYNVPTEPSGSESEHDADS